MSFKSTLSLFIGSATALVFLGCTTTRTVSDKATSPLEDYFKTYDFSYFNPPRMTDGIGTIIAFDTNGVESIISTRSVCLPEKAVPSLPKDEQRVALLSGSYRFDKTNKSEIGISENFIKNYIDPGFDLSAAFNLSEIKEIEITWVDPFRDRITKIKAKDYIRSLQPTSSCVEEINRPKNLVIHTVLGAKGAKYKFIGQNDKELVLTAKMADAMNAGSEFKNNWIGKLGFEITDTMLFGYRSWKAAEVPGALKNGVEFKELSSKEVEQIKELSR